MATTTPMPCDEAMCKMMPEMPCCKNGTHPPMHMTMDMWFTFSTDSTILFKFWTTTDGVSMAWSCAIVFLLAFLFEAVKFFRLYLNDRAIVIRKHNLASGDKKIAQIRMMSKFHLIQTIWHTVQILISYFLMLIFMTFNGYLCIAVVVGEVCGYLVFGWKKSVASDLEGHCG